MTTQPTTAVATDLAGRLRGLRESRFDGVKITQRALGRALGGDKPLSAPLISAWEKGSAVPTKRWIAAYATFFATIRSIQGGSLRLLRDHELEAEERATRDALHRELTRLRAEAMRSIEAKEPDPRSALGGLWHFSDGAPVRIVCSELPKEQQSFDATPAHPTLGYGELYSFSSIDALFELHGHLRAANPQSDVRLLKDSVMGPDDFSEHLVVLGGVDWNPLTMRIPLFLPNVPVRQISTGDDRGKAYFEVRSDDAVEQYRPEISDGGELLSDVGHFLRVPSPFNKKRTLTLCAGVYSLGTLGVVRALTDIRFRERNEAFLRERFQQREMISVLMRILVVNGDEALTPDWTEPDIRLHEWPEAPSR